MGEPFDRYREIVDDWAAFSEACNRPLPVTAWANPLKISPADLKAHLAAQGIAAEPLSWRQGAYRLPDLSRPGSRIAYLAGLLHLQEEVSMLPVELLDLRSGQRILDTCAAPGNKTAQIATSLGRGGTLVANDINYRRMKGVVRTLERLGALNTTILVEDAANLPGSMGTFDRILADVPCSCEGTSRKHAVLPATSRDFHHLGGTQRAILRRALGLIRPGGRVVYSTCTYAPEENEAVIDAVLAEFDGAIELLPARIPGFPASRGLVEWRGQRFDSSLQRSLRVYPHQHDTGGFFVAVLQRGDPS
jgi:NOL1/NOP2/sun family putative RNA methylase